MRINGSQNEISLYFEVVEHYNKYKNKINKSLKIHDESDLLDFCMSHAWVGAAGPANIPATGHLVYENVCKLIYIFSNILGRQMPDNIHSRLIFGPNNEWVKEYVNYTKNLKPFLFGFINLNKNNFYLHGLSTNGTLRKFVLK